MTNGFTVTNFEDLKNQIVLSKNGEQMLLKDLCSKAHLELRLHEKINFREDSDLNFIYTLEVLDTDITFKELPPFFCLSVLNSHTPAYAKKFLINYINKKLLTNWKLQR